MNKTIASVNPGDLGVGIIGVGSMGQRHANAMRTVHGARLVAVADMSKELTARVAKEHGVDACFTAADLVSRKDVDCVIIATNDEAHVEPVAAAASAGKHILLEKPIATTIPDADKIIQLCAKAKIKLMIGFTLRFNPKYARVKQAVAAGEIGELEAIYCRRANLTTTQESYKGRVSAICFLGVHDIDFMRWVTNSEVKQVHTEAVWNFHKKHGYNVEDIAWTLLRFNNGVVGALETSWMIPVKHPNKMEVQLEAVGTGGIIQYDVTKQELTFTKPEGYYAEQFNRSVQYELEHFFDCVRNDRIPLVTGADGRAALEVVVAAELSAKEHRIISLPFA